jgi:glutaredoxin-like YruB-family protein
MKDITIYSTPMCHFCNLAKEYFNANGIKYTDHNLIGNPEKQKEMIELTGQMGVPVIVIGDDIVIGFDKPRIADLLGL